MKLKVIIWLIGLLLMCSYQYWVYSSFWISDDFTQSKKVTHFSGDILSIECIDERKKKYGPLHQYFWVELSGKRLITFSDEGTLRSCSDFDIKFSNLFEEQKIDVDIGSFGTKIGTQYFYPKLRFEGYFTGNFPLQIKIDSYEWMSSDKMQKAQRGIVLWMSLVPIFIFLCVYFGRLYKQGRIHSLIEFLGSNPK